MFKQASLTILIIGVVLFYNGLFANYEKVVLWVPTYYYFLWAGLACVVLSMAITLCTTIARRRRIKAELESRKDGEDEDTKSDPKVAPV